VLTLFKVFRYTPLTHLNKKPSNAAAFVVVFAIFVAALDAECEALSAAWLLLVDDVQPATDKEATISNRTIIAVNDLNCIRLFKRRR